MSRTLFFFFALCLVGIIALANTVPGVFTFVHIIPFGDKVGHFVLLGTLAFLAGQWVTLSFPQLGENRLLAVGLLIATLITAEEFSQVLIPSRQFDLGDLVVNLCGIVAGLLFFRFLYQNSSLYQTK